MSLASSAASCGEIVAQAMVAADFRIHLYNITQIELSLQLLQLLFSLLM